MCRPVISERSRKDGRSESWRQANLLESLFVHERREKECGKRSEREREKEKKHAVLYALLRKELFPNLFEEKINESKDVAATSFLPRLTSTKKPLHAHLDRLDGFSPLSCHLFSPEKDRSTKVIQPINETFRSSLWGGPHKKTEKRTGELMHQIRYASETSTAVQSRHPVERRLHVRRQGCLQRLANVKRGCVGAGFPGKESLNSAARHAAR
mmetsp:Transcript_26283/g.51605  ORF Transcript_26283/g.51605 Transcript_26283/m.51605 type:complete len:212 (+) Transcript_26283:319-954(+)